MNQIITTPEHRQHALLLQWQCCKAHTGARTPKRTGLNFEAVSSRQLKLQNGGVSGFSNLEAVPRGGLRVEDRSRIWYREEIQLTASLEGSHSPQHAHSINRRPALILPSFITEFRLELLFAPLFPFAGAANSRQLPPLSKRYAPLLHSSSPLNFRSKSPSARAGLLIRISYS
jgi:hypothetical protein